jgi:hypothetical protein
MENRTPVGILTRKLRVFCVRASLLLAIYKNPYKNDVTLKTIDRLGQALNVLAEKLIESVKEPPQ